MSDVPIDAGGRSLKHEKIREYVRGLISAESPGAPAPSERELVHRFGVARMTVRQAMDALVVEGLLERVPGRGTFVARPKRSTTPVLSFTEEMRRRGLQAESQTLLARREQAGPGVARAMGIEEGGSVVHWRRLRRADGEPMCLEDVYLNESLVPGFLQVSMPTSLYDELERQGMAASWVEDAVSADLVTADEAALLEVARGSAVLRKQRRALAGEQVVEVSRAVYRADRYSLRVELGAAESS
ncbi:GntR family transcriptional regulator [Nocardioides sp.]|uniref:GntR family transcriptional regulator n=1 Tax=Nocardioides sp. TaxID=35761 RepID=UPI0039E268B0